MKIIIGELISIHEKNLHEGEITQFLQDIEAELVKIRFKYRNIDTELDDIGLGKTKTKGKPQKAYCVPFWCFLYYSRSAKHKRVIDVIKDFIVSDSVFLEMYDFERLEGGAVRAVSNLRFAADTLKNAGVLSKEKQDDWTAYKLTEQGVADWLIVENCIKDNKVCEIPYISDILAKVPYDLLRDYIKNTTRRAAEEAAQKAKKLLLEMK